MFPRFSICFVYRGFRASRRFLAKQGTRMETGVAKVKGQRGVKGKGTRQRAKAKAKHASIHIQRTSRRGAARSGPSGLVRAISIDRLPGESVRVDRPFILSRISLGIELRGAPSTKPGPYCPVARTTINSFSTAVTRPSSTSDRLRRPVRATGETRSSHRNRDLLIALVRFLGKWERIMGLVCT